MGPGPCAKAQGREVQIRMDDCTKEPPAFGWRTRYVARTNFAGAKQDDEIGPFREMDVTLQHSRQPKAEMPPDSEACVGSAGIGQVPWSAQRIGGWADDGIIDS